MRQIHLAAGLDEADLLAPATPTQLVMSQDSVQVQKNSMGAIRQQPPDEAYSLTPSRPML